MSDSRTPAGAGGRRSRIAALVALVLLAPLALVMPGATRAAAAGSLGAAITAVSPSVTAGSQTSFKVSWSCSSTTSTCDGMKITVPIPPLRRSL